MLLLLRGRPASSAGRRRFHKIERGRESERGERERGLQREEKGKENREKRERTMAAKAGSGGDQGRGRGRGAGRARACGAWPGESTAVARRPPPGAWVGFSGRERDER